MYRYGKIVGKESEAKYIYWKCNRQNDTAI